MDIIYGLLYNTSTGLNGITSEHIKFADPQLVVLWLILVASKLVSPSWLYTVVISESVIVPVIKDNNRGIRYGQCTSSRCR